LMMIAKTPEKFFLKIRVVIKRVKVVCKVKKCSERSGPRERVNFIRFLYECPLIHACLYVP